MKSCQKKLLLALAVATALCASDPPKQDTTSLGTSRHRDEASSSSPGFDERAIRVEQLMHDLDLSPFVAYTNTGQEPVVMQMINSKANHGTDVMVIQEGKVAMLDFEGNLQTTLAAGRTAYFASRKRMDQAFDNACFAVSDPRGATHYVAMWFQPLAQGRDRLLVLPNMHALSLVNALANWNRKQTAPDK